MFKCPAKKLPNNCCVSMGFRFCNAAGVIFAGLPDIGMSLCRKSFSGYRTTRCVIRTFTIGNETQNLGQFADSIEPANILVCNAVSPEDLTVAAVGHPYYRAAAR